MRTPDEEQGEFLASVADIKGRQTGSNGVAHFHISICHNVSHFVGGGLLTTVDAGSGFDATGFFLPVVPVDSCKASPWNSGARALHAWRTRIIKLHQDSRQLFGLLFSLCRE